MDRDQQVQLYTHRVRERGYSSWRQALAETDHLTLGQASELLGWDRRVISRERRVHGIYSKLRPRPERLALRQRLASQHGYTDWDDALEQTLHLSSADAALKLGLSPALIRRDRVRAGLVVPIKRGGFDAGDASDPRHGLFGYRRRCRCLKCRVAYNEHRRRIRQLAAMIKPDHPHGLGGYTNYSCRCEICRGAWHEYKMARKLIPKEGVEHGVEGWQQGCRCPQCRQTSFRSLGQRKEMTPDDARHGTTAGYKARCRCEACRQADALAQRLRRERRRERARQEAA